MRAIFKLFGRSPFSPLQAHMDKVAQCVEKLPALFDAMFQEEQERVEEIAYEISKLEHKADLEKNDIRNGLGKKVFLPVNKEHLLEILTLQDSIADCAEDIGVLLTLRKVDMIEGLAEGFREFLEKNVEAFIAAHNVVKEIGELLESSFGGVEAEKVVAMVDAVALNEHEADIIQSDLLKKLYRTADETPHWAFHLWLRILEHVGKLSNLSEKLAYRVRMTLEC